MHWREKELLYALQEGELTTSELVQRVNMSKVTALKYLETLKKIYLVDFKEIGPTKIWFLQSEGKTTKKVIKVLVADDDKNVVDIIRDSLNPDLFEVVEALNGKEALGMVFAESPDILILDIMMPGMDGYEVCEELRKQNTTKDLPIIILSAKTRLEDKLRAMDIGISDYIAKPFDIRELEARIQMALKKNSSI